MGSLIEKYLLTEPLLQALRAANLKLIQSLKNHKF
jgi:hypothetical protein